MRRMRKIKEIKIGKWPVLICLDNKYGGWQWNFNIDIWNFGFHVGAYIGGGRTFRIRIDPKHLSICGYFANGDGIAFVLHCERYEHRIRHIVKHFKETDPEKLKEIRKFFRELLLPK